MQANTFDVVERRKRITFFKLGKLWVFKQFFDNHELFNALLDYYFHPETVYLFPQARFPRQEMYLGTPARIQSFLQVLVAFPVVCLIPAPVL